MMQVNFVPETMPLQLMLQNFIKHRSNIAVVIDEFGGTAGVISLEDVLEQIFGEIEDEHDIPDLTEKQVGQDEYVLSCRLEVKYLNEKYGLGIEESKEYDTLAGFIIFNYDGIDRRGNGFHRRPAVAHTAYDAFAYRAGEGQEIVGIFIYNKGLFRINFTTFDC